MPNDATMHEFLALVLFAQGKYEQAAAPLYAVLSVGPGWDWTTLIGNYNDANLYTEQLRALEAYVKANPGIGRGPVRAGVPLHHARARRRRRQPAEGRWSRSSRATRSRPSFSRKLQPASVGSSPTPAAPPQRQPFDAGKLTGDWVAQAPQNAKVSLSIKSDGGFTWAVAVPGKPATSITGISTVADGVLTLDDKDAHNGALSGQVVWQDDTHFAFRAIGAPADDPGLKFAR